MKAVQFSVQNQDPLSSARALLKDIWETEALEGLFIPVWPDDGLVPECKFCHDSSQLIHADPFAPVMTSNRAPDALRTLRDHPHGRVGVFLRPCEWRTFQVLMAESGEAHDHLLSLSADCTGAMGEEDFYQLSAGDTPGMTDKVLHFAAQGGILPSRRQSSCQLCDDPLPDDVDLHIELFGVPTNEYLILNFKDHALATTVSAHASGFDAPSDAILRRDEVLQDLLGWRANSFEKQRIKLGDDLISLKGLLAHLQCCESCRTALLEHCPLFDLEILSDTDVQAFDRLRIWLNSCSGCGVCERDCPDSYPLFNVIFSLRGIA